VRVGHLQVVLRRPRPADRGRHDPLLRKLSGDDFVNIGGRCYDHNFLRIWTIVGEKIGGFLKKQCYDQICSKFSFILSQKRQFFR
jgi:hypothetical protein